MNIKYFPFDEQKCVLEFGSWTYDGSQLNIDVSYPEMSLSEYKNLFFPGCRTFDTTIDLQILNINVKPSQEITCDQLKHFSLN